MSQIIKYPGYHFGAIQNPFAARELRGRQYVKTVEKGLTVFFETAGRVNGNYPIRRILHDNNRQNAIELKEVAALFDMPYEQYRATLEEETATA